MRRGEFFSVRCFESQRPGHRLCRHRHDERARRAGAAVRRLFLRRGGKRRPGQVRHARAADRLSVRRRRHRAARRRDVFRLHFRSRSGNRPAAGLAHFLSRRRCRLPPGRRRGPPVGIAVGSHGDVVAASGARSGPGHRHRPAFAAGRLGDARKREVLARPVQDRARSHRRSAAGSRRAAAAAAAHRHRRCRRAPDRSGGDRSFGVRNRRRLRARHDRDAELAPERTRAGRLPRCTVAERRAESERAAGGRLRRPLARRGADPEKPDGLELRARYLAHASRHARRDHAGFLFRSLVALGLRQYAVRQASGRRAGLGRRCLRFRGRQCAGGAERRRRVGNRPVRGRRTDRAERMAVDEIIARPARQRRRHAPSGSRGRARRGAERGAGAARSRPG